MGYQGLRRAENASRGVKKVCLTIGFADLTASASSQSFDFAAALPAEAVIIGVGIDVSTAFDDGSTGVYTADLGISSGDTDAFLNGVDLEVAAAHAAPQGAQPTGLVGAVTPALIVDAGAVDVDTTIAGALVVTILYVDAAAF